MKKFKLLMIALLCVLGATSCSAQKLFTEAANVKGVTSVFVTKSMLNMVGATMGNQGGVDTGKLMKKINSVEVLEIPRDKKKTAEPLCQKALSGREMETLVDVKESDNTVLISALRNPGKDTYQGMLIKTDSDDELVYVYMAGDFTLADLMQAVGDADNPESVDPNPESSDPK